MGSALREIDHADPPCSPFPGRVAHVFATHTPDRVLASFVWKQFFALSVDSRSRVATVKRCESFPASRRRSRAPKSRHEPGARVSSPPICFSAAAAEWHALYSLWSRLVCASLARLKPPVGGQDRHTQKIRCCRRQLRKGIRSHRLCTRSLFPFFLSLPAPLQLPRPFARNAPSPAKF